MFSPLNNIDLADGRRRLLGVYRFRGLLSVSVKRRSEVGGVRGVRGMGRVLHRYLPRDISSVTSIAYELDRSHLSSDA